MTPKDFVPHLMQVLGDLSQRTPGVAIPMEDTFEFVCARMGLQVSNFGTAEGKKTPWVYRQIGLAFRQMRDNGLGEYASRGHWALTQEGVEQLKPDHTPEAPTAAALAAVKAQAAEEDADDNVVHLSDPGNEHPYSDDPYIRGLAVEQTACFGAHSVRSDVCKGCLLAEDCLVAISVRKAEIASELERDEMVAREAAKTKAKKKDQQDASIDELMGSMEGTDNTSAKFGKKGKFNPLPEQIVSDAFAQQESVCAQCNEKIPEGASCFWVEGEGIFHPECINAPDGV